MEVRQQDAIDRFIGRDLSIARDEHMMTEHFTATATILYILEV